MEMDSSLKGWIFNTHTTIKSPITVISVVLLLIAGSFAKIAPRKSLEFLDTSFGSLLFFVTPLAVSMVLDWPTGLLTAVISLILVARLEDNDVSEGFSTSDDLSTMTELIPNPKRWFVEKLLGETPIAILSDRVSSSEMRDINTRTSSSSAMSSAGTSDGTSNK
jgi:hypothetical protein